MKINDFQVFLVLVVLRLNFPKIDNCGFDFHKIPLSGIDDVS